jgi:hypothetical protein
MRLGDMTLRLGMAATLAVSGAGHAYLYIHGYRYIPNIGTAFQAQASIGLAVGVLLVVGGPAWLRWVAAGLAGGSLVAFGLSRTVGLLGFSERAFQPAPNAAISVVAELLTVLLWAVWLVHSRASASTT